MYGIFALAILVILTLGSYVLYVLLATIGELEFPTWLFIFLTAMTAVSNYATAMRFFNWLHLTQNLLAQMKKPRSRVIFL